MIRLFTAICLLMTSSMAIQAEEISAEKLAVIKELMAVTGAAANASQFSQAFTQQMTAVLRVSNPDISERALEIVQEEVAKVVAEELQNESLQSQIYPLYARYFTLDELQGLVAFNKSPVGQKANAVMPQLIEQSLIAGQEWSRQVQPLMSERILNRFREEGITIRTQ